MNKVLAFWIGVLGLAMAMPAFADTRPEPNAFLNRPANSLQAVIRQIETDPEVADRFVRHFGMSRDAVVDYFRTLRTDQLREAGVYRVYNAQPNGEIQWRMLRLRAGTVVYVDASGQPILKANCANPMVTGTDRLQGDMAAPATAMAATATMLEMAVQAEGEALWAVSVMQPQMPVVEEEGIFDVEVPLTTVTEIAGGSPAGLGGFAGLPLLGLGGFLLGGSNGGGVVPIVTDPIPEPATVVALALGAGLLATRRRRHEQH